MTLEERLRLALAQCSERGWENFTISSTRGDSNCPHPVTYHPKDGHGWEQYSKWLDATNRGQSAALDDEIDYRDSVMVLCELLESFPDIEDRPLILKPE